MEDDEEYVELVREAFIHSDEKDVPSGPTMRDWSETKDQTADLVDELRMLRATATVAATVGGKETPKQYDRPTTLMMEASASAKITKRRLKHEALVGRLVPKKE